MTELEKEPESQVKIRFPDCDPFNQLNNSRYIDYMINAREDQLLECYGFDPYRLARKEGLGWVAAQTQIAYLSPAGLMEVVTIKTRLLSAGAKSLLVEAQMWNSDKTTLKSLMWTTLVHFDIRQGKSLVHSSELTDLLNKIEAPLSTAGTFDERLGELRSLLTPQV